MKKTQELKTLGWDFIEEIDETDVLQSTIDEEWALEALAYDSGNVRYLLFEEGQLAHDMWSTEVVNPTEAYETLMKDLDEE
jgi:hypothetical protein